MEELLIKVEGLTKQYRSDQKGGIESINFEIKSGDIVAIIGASGSGKSTLLKCIYGLITPDSGYIDFDGKKVKGPEEQLIPGHKEMKMVTQDFSLNIYAKVYDNIASQLSNTQLNLKAEKTIAVMQHLRIDHLKNKRIIELSGGEQQRVAIAKAMVSDTKVLLLDEPFSQVDALVKNQLRADIKRAASEIGVTVILVSHDPTDGLFLADQLLILKDGKLLQSGTPRAIYHQPKHLYTAKLLGNAVTLNATDAAKIGIQGSKKNIAFYPEWAKLTDQEGGLQFKILDVYFKGFYEELLLEREGVTIRVLQVESGLNQKNDYVNVNINRFFEFD